MNVPQISAFFESSLASSMSAAATSFTLASATDRDGNALSGLYGFVIDPDTSDREYVIGTVSGTAVTVTYRGIDADAPNTEIAGNKKAHRRGAIVKISDYPILGVLRNLINGTDTIPNVLKYASGVTPSTADDLADKGYVDGVAIAGGADASTTVKGITKLSTAPASATNPIAVGDNDPRVPTQSENDALAGTSGTAVSSSNKLVDNADTATSGAGKVLRLDGTGKLPALDGSQLTNLIVLEAATASDNLKASADTERTEGYNTSFAKKKEIIARVGGTIRVKFDLKFGGPAGNARAVVYINGAAVGTERTTTSTSYTTYSEDIKVAPYDKVQLYARHDWNDGASIAYVRNFRLYWDKAFSSTYFEVITD
jgi:hypothetical protein